MLQESRKQYGDIVLFGLLFWLKAFAFRVTIMQPLFVKGIFSDLMFSVLVCAFVTLLCSKRIRVYILFGLNVIFSLIWFSASTYYNYYGNVPTYLTLTSLGQVGKIGDSITASILPIYYMYAVDLIILLIVFIINIVKRKPKRKDVSYRKKTTIYSFVIVVIALIVSTLLIRQAQSITNEKELARHLGFFHYQVAFAIQHDKQIANKQALTEEERVALMHEINQFISTDDETEAVYFGVAKDNNVISIQLEALQNFVIGLEINGQIITPFLNEYVKDNFYFSNVYQQIGEGNTSDAEFLANTGAYPQGTLAMSKIVGGKNVQSLANLLKRFDYRSYTFHVNDVSFWNRSELYPALGFDAYYDKPYFENDNFNFFGASDEQLYKVVYEELLQKHESDEQFYAHVIATSGHHPFVIPEQYQVLTLPDGLVDTQLGHYLQAAHYVDKQLEVFISKLEQSGMLEDTTLVIYGDHFGLQEQDNAPEWVSQQLGIPYHHVLSRFNIPLIISVPDVQGEEVTLTGGQVDIVPTLLNLLGIKVSDVHALLFGEDLLNSMTNTIGIRYYMPTGTFINEDILYVPGDSFETGQAIDIHTFEPIESLGSLKDDYEYIIQLMKYSDQFTSNYEDIKIAN